MLYVHLIELLRFMIGWPRKAGRRHGHYCCWDGCQEVQGKVSFRSSQGSNEELGVDTAGVSVHAFGDIHFHGGISGCKGKGHGAMRPESQIRTEAEFIQSAVHTIMKRYISVALLLSPWS